MRISDWSSDVCSSDLREIDGIAKFFSASVSRSARERSADWTAPHGALYRSHGLDPAETRHPQLRNPRRRQDRSPVRKSLWTRRGLFGGADPGPDQKFPQGPVDRKSVG